MLTVNSKSYYGYEFFIQQSPYEGPQYDTIACLLPGQGLIKPGFLKTDLKKIHSVQKYLTFADRWLKSKYPDLEFTVTDYSNRPQTIAADYLYAVQNIFLLSISCGFFELIEQKGYEKLVITSHSFGEYASFVCSGAVKFESMLDIVWMRELCSPKAHSKGGLVALNIGLHDFILLKNQDADLQKVEVANINSDQQIVIAAELTNVPTVTKVLKKHKVAYKILTNVTQPYHSSLMKESADRFRDWLHRFDFSPEPLKYSVLSSVNQKYYPAKSFLDRLDLIEIFVQQLTCKVNFVEQIKKLNRDYGIVSYIQLIEGDTYLTFIQNSFTQPVLRSLQLSSVDFFYKTNLHADQISRLDLEKLKSSRIFKRLTEHIEAVTGFSVLEIEIMDQFQADLRIDSIKKAEIVFKTLEDFNIHIEESLSLAQFKTIAEVVNYLDGIKYNKKSNRKKSLQTEKSKYMTLFQLDESKEDLDLFPAHKEGMQKELSTCFYRITEADLRNSIRISVEPTDIFVLEVTDLEMHFNEESYSLDKFLNLFSYLKSLLEEVRNTHHLNPLLKFVLISRKNYSHLQALIAFIKSFCKEYHIPFKSIQVLQTMAQPDLENLVLSECRDNYSTDVIYNHEARNIKSWKPLGKTERAHQNEINNIVIIGGARGFAGAQLKHFKKSDKKVCVLGRTDPGASEIVKFLENNKKKFSGLYYKQCDASKTNDLENVLAEIKKNWGSIDLVINAAGYEKSEELHGKSIDSASLEFSSKYEITKNLIGLYKKFDFKILNYSSIVGYFGNEGQTVYSFSNGYQLDLDVLNILWPAIDKVGMTAHKGLYEKMRATGLHFAKVEETVELLEDIINYYSAYKQTSRNILYSHPQDIFLFESKSLDLHRLRMLAGQIVNLDEVSFAKEFSLLRDSFLNDHKIETTAVIPASYIVSLFLNIARYYLKQPKLELFSIKNILLFTQTQLNCDLTLSPKLTQIKHENHLVGFNCSVSTQVDNYTAQISLSLKNDKAPNRTLGRYAQSVLMNTIYSEDCVNFGYKFQLIKNIYLNQKNGQFDLIGVSNDQLFYYSGDSRFDAIMFLVEAAFQMACVNGLLTHRGLGIPSKFESLIVHRLDFKTLFIVPVLLETSSFDHNFLCNVTVYNEKNECIAEFKKLEMTPIKNFSNLPIRFIDASYDI